jgi:hypothetical protein
MATYNTPYKSGTFDGAPASGATTFAVAGFTPAAGDVIKGSSSSNRSYTPKPLSEEEKERQRAEIRKLLEAQHKAAQEALEASTDDAPKEIKKRVRRLSRRAKTLLETSFEPTPKMARLAKYKPTTFEGFERQLNQLAHLIRMQEEEDLLLLLSY